MFKIDELLKAVSGNPVQFAARRDVSGISIDSRDFQKGNAFIAIKGKNFDGHDFVGRAVEKGASCVIIKRQGREFFLKISRRAFKKFKQVSVIEVGDTVRALGDIARYWRRKFDIPLVAVTGSNGKTTTKEMVRHLLSGRYKVLSNAGTQNNQIGLPLTLLKLRSSHDLAVLEIGSSHFGEVEYLSRICAPNIGAITNIGPSHLEYFKSLNGVLKEKCSLIDNLDKPHLALLNADDILLKARASKKSKMPLVLTFALNNRADFHAHGIELARGRLNFTLNSRYRCTLKTPGYHNIYNALIAIAVAKIFGIGYNDIIHRFLSFVFPEGRLRLTRLKGVGLIDDTYNSNPLSFAAALEALRRYANKGRKIVVMGDMLEMGRQSRFFHYHAGGEAAKICDILIAVGESCRFAALAAEAVLGPENVFRCKCAKAAREILWKKVSPRRDDLILVKGSRSVKMEEALLI